MKRLFVLFSLLLVIIPLASADTVDHFIDRFNAACDFTIQFDEAEIGVLSGEGERRFVFEWQLEDGTLINIYTPYGVDNVIQVYCKSVDENYLQVVYGALVGYGISDSREEAINDFSKILVFTQDGRYDMKGAKFTAFQNDEGYHFSITDPAYVIAFSTMDEAVSEDLSSEDLSWGPAYYDYIINDRFPIAGESYYPEHTAFGGYRYMPMFALHDMDADGIPELIVENGCDYIADLKSNVYTYRDNEVQFISITHECPLYYFPESSYPGIFYRAGSMDWFFVYYDEVKNGELSWIKIYDEYREQGENSESKPPVIVKAEENNALVDALYDLYMDGTGKKELQFYSAADIRSMGLHSFMRLFTNADLTGITERSGKQGNRSDDSEYDVLFSSDRAECLFLDGTAGTARPAVDIGTDNIFLFGKNSNTLGYQDMMEWDVLAVEDHGVLLITRYVIDCEPYEETRHAITWEKCSLRSWMNERFLQTNFTQEQQDAILRVRLQNPDNPKYGTKGGGNTTDRIFALSYAEGERYLTKENINTTATEYAIARGAKLRNENKKKTVYWWLRTPGDVQERAMVTSLKNDALDYEGNGVARYFDIYNQNNTGVRPALWLSWDYINRHPESVMKKSVVVSGTLIKNSVGLRSVPGKNAEKLAILNRGTVVTVLGKKWDSGELWYYVEVNGMRGYLNSTMLDVEDAGSVPEM